MDWRWTCRSARFACAAACTVILCCGAGCAGALMAVSLVGGAAIMSGETERLSGSHGQDFDEQRASLIQSGLHTQADVAGILGHPQSKVFTNIGEEWSYRYYAPPTMFRSGLEKILTIRFRDGKVNDVRYTVSAL